MKATLKAGDTYTHQFTVTDAKTVPKLYPESVAFRSMPAVFATGYLVGLIEWACMEALKPHLDEGEGSLGVAIAISHLAPTPPGMKVTTNVTCLTMQGRQIEWRVAVSDERDAIAEGTHKRAVVTWDRFSKRLAEKTATIGR